MENKNYNYCWFSHIFLLSIKLTKEIISTLWVNKDKKGKTIFISILRKFILFAGYANNYSEKGLKSMNKTSKIRVNKIVNIIPTIKILR